MLSPTFGRSWKLQIPSSLKQCIASLKFVMAGPNALPKYLRDASWYLPFKFFLEVLAGLIRYLRLLFHR